MTFTIDIRHDHKNRTVTLDVHAGLEYSGHLTMTEPAWAAFKLLLGSGAIGAQNSGVIVKLFEKGGGH